MGTFSILERIDLSETAIANSFRKQSAAFSILERIDLSETWGEGRKENPLIAAFSILERIDLSETV